MKTLGLMMVLLLLPFLGTNDATGNNPESKGKAFDVTVEFTNQFYCMCAGEYIIGTVVFNVVDNGKTQLWSVKNSDLVGSISGQSYKLVLIEKYLKFGDIFGFRVIGENGLVSNIMFVSMNNYFRPPC